MVTGYIMTTVLCACWKGKYLFWFKTKVWNRRGRKWQLDL